MQLTTSSVHQRIAVLVYRDVVEVCVLTLSILIDIRNVDVIACTRVLLPGAMLDPGNTAILVEAVLDQQVRKLVSGLPVRTVGPQGLASLGGFVLNPVHVRFRNLDLRNEVLEVLVLEASLR